MQQMQLMQQRNVQLQRRDPNHPALSGLGGSLNAINSEGMLGQPPASVLAMKMYEERMKHPHSMDSEASPNLIDANRMALLKSATSHQGQLVHGNSGNMSNALQQLQARSTLTNDIKGDVNIGAGPKNLPLDTSVYRQAILQSKSGLGSAGKRQAEEEVQAVSAKKQKLEEVHQKKEAELKKFKNDESSYEEEGILDCRI
ncbi:transcriptional corepressor LEUNIG_HOMOLOG-like [Trifolium pratense]|uniref:transcriptional corepressor LEUNIG_HOMOLOG-like n=1 Tax=Trifolium pratense TaxID=57577 RepID=UPI001E696668|nr:transcriptional corepressor LEUNIG_HOMOLOG-like [Trifolium pratense]XP_045817540.1 transcriptional corepressor LEUNIG_HOMOLOG-like [Trifolium pratense]